ncbi:MAG: hypothetical protein FJ161_01750 [Gammaproteobacteria bacterium]|nr:hypothetical protein [Gammaproteobacteria bacterium]
MDRLDYQKYRFGLDENGNIKSVYRFRTQQDENNQSTIILESRALPLENHDWEIISDRTPIVAFSLTQNTPTILLNLQDSQNARWVSIATRVKDSKKEPDLRLISMFRVLESEIILQMTQDRTTIHNAREVFTGWSTPDPSIDAVMNQGQKDHVIEYLLQEHMSHHQAQELEGLENIECNRVINNIWQGFYNVTEEYDALQPLQVCFYQKDAQWFVRAHWVREIVDYPIADFFSANQINEKELFTKWQEWIATQPQGQLEVPAEFQGFMIAMGFALSSTKLYQMQAYIDGIWPLEQKRTSEQQSLIVSSILKRKTVENDEISDLAIQSNLNAAITPYLSALEPLEIMQLFRSITNDRVDRCIERLELLAFGAAQLLGANLTALEYAPMPQGVDHIVSEQKIAEDFFTGLHPSAEFLYNLITDLYTHNAVAFQSIVCSLSSDEIKNIIAVCYDILDRPALYQNFLVAVNMQRPSGWSSLDISEFLTYCLRSRKKIDRDLHAYFDHGLSFDRVHYPFLRTLFNEVLDSPQAINYMVRVFQKDPSFLSEYIADEEYNFSETLGILLQLGRIEDVVLLIDNGVQFFNYEMILQILAYKDQRLFDKMIALCDRVNLSNHSLQDIMIALDRQKFPRHDIARFCYAYREQLIKTPTDRAIFYWFELEQQDSGLPAKKSQAYTALDGINLLNILKDIDHESDILGLPKEFLKKYNMGVCNGSMIAEIFETIFTENFSIESVPGAADMIINLLEKADRCLNGNGDILFGNFILGIQKTSKEVKERVLLQMHSHMPPAFVIFLIVSLQEDYKNAGLKLENQEILKYVHDYVINQKSFLNTHDSQASWILFRTSFVKTTMISLIHHFSQEDFEQMHQHEGAETPWSLLIVLHVYMMNKDRDLKNIIDRNFEIFLKMMPLHAHKNYNEDIINDWMNYCYEVLQDNDREKASAVIPHLLDADAMQKWPIEKMHPNILRQLLAHNPDTVHPKLDLYIQKNMQTLTQSIEMLHLICTHNQYKSDAQQYIKDAFNRNMRHLSSENFLTKNSWQSILLFFKDFPESGNLFFDSIYGFEQRIYDGIMQLCAKENTLDDLSVFEKQYLIDQPTVFYRVIIKCLQSKHVNIAQVKKWREFYKEHHGSNLNKKEGNILKFAPFLDVTGLINDRFLSEFCYNREAYKDLSDEFSLFTQAYNNQLIEKSRSGELSDAVAAQCLLPADEGIAPETQKAMNAFGGVGVLLQKLRGNCKYKSRSFMYGQYLVNTKKNGIHFRNKLYGLVKDLLTEKPDLMSWWNQGVLKREYAIMLGVYSNNEELVEAALKSDDPFSAIEIDYNIFYFALRQPTSSKILDRLIGAISKNDDLIDYIFLAIVDGGSADLIAELLHMQKVQVMSCNKVMDIDSVHKIDLFNLCWVYNRGDVLEAILSKDEQNKDKLLQRFMEIAFNDFLYSHEDYIPNTLYSDLERTCQFILKLIECGGNINDCSLPALGTPLIRVLREIRDHRNPDSLDHPNLDDLKSLVKFLLENGADPSLKNSRGESAYDFASQCNPPLDLKSMIDSIAAHPYRPIAPLTAILDSKPEHAPRNRESK